jgi:predicted AAA+ superfamily ATPase
LKYFCENAPQYHVVAAGSLLGTYLTGSFSYPVGKVNLLDMYPLTFEEFLQATDNKLHRAYATENDMVDILHKEFLDTYRKYLTIGGLPKSVQTWAETKDFAEVKKVQDQLQEVYETDFTKHVGKIEPAKILMIWRNVSAQLAKENKKFIYGDIQQGARARSFEEAIEWLVTANLVNRVYRATKNTMPLNVYTDLSAFKLYMFDTGLLKNMAGVPNESILLDKDFMFKGALVENYVLQELTPIFTATPPKYFTFNQYENDFLIQTQSGEIVPIEVKAGDRTDSPSFKVYNEKFNPKTRVMYSTLPLKWEHDRNCVNIPLYLVGKTKEILARI